MTLSQLSSQLRFDQAGALARFGGSEALLLRFLRRLPEDKTFAALSDAVAAGDLTGVERGAHTLKGVAANLGLDALRDAAATWSPPCAAARPTRSPPFSPCSATPIRPPAGTSPSFEPEAHP